MTLTHVGEILAQTFSLSGRYPICLTSIPLTYIHSFIFFFFFFGDFGKITADSKGDGKIWVDKSADSIVFMASSPGPDKPGNQLLPQINHLYIFVLTLTEVIVKCKRGC